MNAADIERVEALIEAGDLDGAYSAVVAIAQATPTDFAAIQILSQICVQKGDLDTAEALLVELVRADANNAEANNDLAVLLHARGDANGAKRHFARALQIEPASKPAIVNMVDVCWSTGAYAEALEALRRSVDAVTARDERSTATTSTFSDTDRLFLKNVPEDLWGKKTGRNIAIVTDFDVAGQPSLLCRTINAHTIHKARLVVIKGDYLAYDRDLILDGAGADETQECFRVIDEADLFHIGRFPVDFGPVKWRQILRADNAIIQYFGSEVRHRGDEAKRFHDETGILAISGADYTMLENALFFYHVKVMCDLNRITSAPPIDGTIRIFHSPTNRAFKRTDLFLEVFERLKTKFPVELDLVEGLSNAQCLARKSTCHMTYDQMSSGAYGLAAIESMAAGHAVLCSQSNFWASCFPDNPIVCVRPDTLESVLEQLLSNPEEIMRVGQAGKAWARRYHDPQVVVRQYLWLYDQVVGGHRLIQSPDEQLI